MRVKGTLEDQENVHHDTDRVEGGQRKEYRFHFRVGLSRILLKNSGYLSGGHHEPLTACKTYLT